MSLSLIALFLGIIGEYLGRIYRQVKRRPLTIIEAEVGTGAYAGAHARARVGSTPAAGDVSAP
jgi:dolichol-phosphate mannosyltransferase